VLNASGSRDLLPPSYGLNIASTGIEAFHQLFEHMFPWAKDEARTASSNVFRVYSHGQGRISRESLHG